MNPSDWQPYISIGKDVVTALAALTGGIVAILGLKAWRKQLKGKTDYQLARRLLRAVYEVRDDIRLIRSPFQSAAEIAQALKETGVSGSFQDPDFDFKTDQAVYQIRWGKLHEALSNLRVEQLEAEVSWGNEVSTRLRPLRECISKLKVAIRHHLRQLSRPQVGKHEPDAEAMEALDRIIYEYGGSAEDEVFTNEIRKAVENIEEFLKPHLKL